MKIKKFKFKQILKLNLLKFKTYESFVKKSSPKLLMDRHLTQIIVNFKKVLKVIYQYNQTHKRILFIGLPKKLELKINKLTNHAAVPSGFEVQGILSNNFQPMGNKKQDLSRHYSKSLFPKLSNSPDLVILVSHSKAQSIISESYYFKIPLIFFNGEIDTNVQTNVTYNVPITTTTNSTLFFIGLNFLFKTNKKGHIAKSERLSALY
jgi:ribosomal protein S2